MIFRLSPLSEARLSTCDARLQQIIVTALQRSPIDFTVLEGYRTVQRQRELYRKGTTQRDGLRKLSKHNYDPAQAVDIAPWPIDWKRPERFTYLAGAVKAVAADLSIPIRWGGDWDRDGDLRDQTLYDLAHFELI